MIYLLKFFFPDGSANLRVYFDEEEMLRKKKAIEEVLPEATIQVRRFKEVF